MSWVNKYRDLRQDFRESTPLWLRKVLKATTPAGGLTALEQAAGAFIPGPGQTGMDYIPSYFSKPRVEDSTQDRGFIGPTRPEGDTGDGNNYFRDGGGSGGGGGTPQAVAPNNANIGSRVYNLNDPAQLQQYIIDIENKLNSDFDIFRQNAENVAEEDIYEAEQEQQKALTQISRALERLGETKDKYNQDYTQSIADLAEGFRQGTARRQMFYAAIAPRVYQSSQGTSQEYAQDKYGEGQKRYEQEKQRAMTEFGRAERDYRESQTDIKNQFRLYKTRRQREKDDLIAQKAREQEDMLGQARAGTLNYQDELKNAGVASNAFNLRNSFQEQDLSGYKPSNVNLNDLMQFIKFQPAGTPGQAGGMTGRSQVMATPEAGGQALGSYMGYAPEEEEPSTINAYKRGNALV